MKLPGRAWLELTLRRDRAGRAVYGQRAIFRPHGLLGQAYWWLLRPFHGVVFGGMLRNIAARSALSGAARQAEQPLSQEVRRAGPGRAGPGRAGPMPGTGAACGPPRSRVSRRAGQQPVAGASRQATRNARRASAPRCAYTPSWCSGRLQPDQDLAQRR
jgi:hypothetical protein